MSTQSALSPILDKTGNNLIDVLRKLSLLVCVNREALVKKRVCGTRMLRKPATMIMIGKLTNGLSLRDLRLSSPLGYSLLHSGVLSQLV